MGIFSFFKRHSDDTQNAINESDLEIVAPVDGTLLPLKEVPDLVISEKLIGDGVAIMPDPNCTSIKAPFEGTISRLIASNNAFAITSNLGIEVYVTMGIGGTSFQGSGLTSNVTIGDTVTLGQDVISVNMNEFSKTLESTVLSIIVVNSSAPIERVISSTGSAKAGLTACTWVLLQQQDIKDKEDNEQIV